MKAALKIKWRPRAVLQADGAESGRIELTKRKRATEMRFPPLRYLVCIIFLFILSQPVLSQELPQAAEDEIVDTYLMYYSPQTLGAAKRAAMAQTYESGGRRFDATMAQVRLIRNWDRLRPETRDRLNGVIQLSEPRNGNRYVLQGTSCQTALGTNNVKMAVSEHFTIYYTLSGSHAVSSQSTNGVPNYILDMIEIFEQSWNHEVNNMALPAPPLGAGNKYPVYVCDLYTLLPGVLGLTNTTETNGYSANSFIEIDNDYANTSPPIHLYNGITIKQLVQVIVAHEFFHAIQFGMNYVAPSYWIMEMSAVWMEDEVYPSVNDYIFQYLPGKFSNTSVPIDHFSSADIYAYGSSVFLKYITEHIAGRSFVVHLWRDIQTACATPQNHPWCDENVTETPLLDTSLQGYGTSLAGVFRDYSAAIYTKDFVDGSLFPNVKTTTLSGNSTYQRNGTLDHLAADYYTVAKPSGTASSKLVLAFTGSSSATWQVSLVTVARNGTVDVQNMALTSGTGTLTATGFGATFSTAVVIINNVHQTADNKTYSLNVSIVNSGCGQSLTSEPYTAGWQLISFPFIPDETDPNAGLNLGSGYLVAYDPASKQLVYSTSPSFPGIGEAGRGYWLYRSPAGALNTYSCPNNTAEQEIALKPGWNIIGNPYSDQVGWSDAKVSAVLDGTADTAALSSAEDRGWLSGALYEWTGSAYAVRQANNGFGLAPWKGYWIEAKRAVTLRMAAP